MSEPRLPTLPPQDIILWLRRKHMRNSVAKIRIIFELMVRFKEKIKKDAENSTPYY